MLTFGISPKVLLPLIVGVLAGGVVLLIGAVSHDQTLETIGLSILGSAAGHAGVGYKAPAGPVQVDAVAQDSEPVVASTKPKPRARKRA